MRVSVEISGMDKLSGQFDSLLESIREKCQKALVDSTLLVHSVAVKSIAEKGSGTQVVTRYNPKRQQLVSEPGHPPNSDLGKLVQNIQFDVDLDAMESQVGTNLDYGAFLEFGTTNMAARPWLFPAFEQSKDEIERLFVEALS